MLSILHSRLSELVIVLGVLGKVLATPAVYEISTPQPSELILKVSTTTKEYMLERIATCESGGKHFNRDGSVIKNYNKNKTTDFGKFQINSTHIPFAEKIGLDILDPQDNKVLAGILFDRFGPDIWYGYVSSSDKCAWEKSANS